MAARRSHLIDLIEPHRTGCAGDRFADSTAAYQGYGQGLELDFIAELRSKIVGDAEPELTILLDISVDQGLARASARGNIALRTDGPIYSRENPRRIFKNRSGKRARVVVIDADQSMDAIEAEIRQHTITFRIELTMDKQTDSFHPRENSRLFGHEYGKDAFGRFCWSLHHSLLITGPKGIGKATLAYRLARHLFKPEEEDGLFGPPEPATVSICRKNISYSDRLQPADTHRLSLGASKEPRNR